jgi:hypothetical protein
VRRGHQPTRVPGPRAPARAGVDPMRLLIERDRQDNIVDVPAAAVVVSGDR